MIGKTNELLWAGLFAAATALAQSDVIQERIPAPGESPARRTMFYVGADEKGVSPALALHGPGTFEFIRSEMGGPAVVKGAPYTAEAVTESTQTLSDGNRIVHSDRTTLARDTEGRTRRDITMPLLPGMGPSDTPKFSFIHDPATNTSYTLNHNSRTATKSMGRSFNIQVMKTPDAAGGVREAGVMARSEVIAAEVAGVAGSGVRAAAPSGTGFATKTTDLGKQTIEGVQAEGTRTVVTIPAGQIGNDRAIDIVSERWYSPELQTVVLTKRNDPRHGETIYRLTGIRRTEPDKSLFEVPASYTLQDAPAGGPDRFIMRRDFPRVKE